MLKLLGAVYLVYLGVQTIPFPRRPRGRALGGAPAGPADRRLFWQGVVVGVTNPKVLVFFAAVLPQFVDSGRRQPDRRRCWCSACCSRARRRARQLWGLAAGAARDWFATSPARLRRVGGAGGLMIDRMGVGLALTGRKD